MIKVESFVNELLASKCYAIIDDVLNSCIIIDPASKECLQEIELIERLRLKLDYIIITHEHTDHCLGVNALKRKYPDSKIVYSEACNKNIKKANRIFFQFYFDNFENFNDVLPPDITIKTSDDYIVWGTKKVGFVLTPGHSLGSMCISIDNFLFTGDTILQFPPVFCGMGCSIEEWQKSVKYITTHFSQETMICPGHGDCFLLKNYDNNSYNI